MLTWRASLGNVGGDPRQVHEAHSAQEAQADMSSVIEIVPAGYIVRNGGGVIEAIEHECASPVSPVSESNRRAALAWSSSRSVNRDRPVD